MLLGNHVEGEGECTSSSARFSPACWMGDSRGIVSALSGCAFSANW